MALHNVRPLYIAEIYGCEFWVHFPNYFTRQQAVNSINAFLSRCGDTDKMIVRDLQKDKEWFELEFSDEVKKHFENE